MINLNSIVQAAHGGQGIDTLAARFGMTPAQAQSAVDALLPAMQMGLQNKMESGGLAAILGHMNNPTTKAAFQDPAAAQSSAATAQGGAILGDLFGGGGTLAQVLQQVAQRTGIPAAVLQAMVPVIASMVIGGLTHSGQAGTGGIGGMLSSVLGSLFGQGTTPAGGSTPSGGSILGDVLGGLVGRTGQPGPGPGAPAADTTTPPPPSRPDTSDPANQTLSEISDLITSGAPPAPEHEAALASILGRPARS